MRHATTLLLACCVIFLAAGTASAKTSMLVVGDSLSIPLGQQLEKFFSLQNHVEFASHGKVSSGLARPEFYNWERKLDSLAAAQAPDVVVIMLGTNDFNTLSGGMKFGTTAWDREYARRVQKLIDIARSHNSRSVVYWMGAPVMGRPDLDKAVRHINNVIEAQVERNEGCSFIDTRDTLADGNGRFAQYVSTDKGRLRLRAEDGVHLTSTGASLLADRCLQALGNGAPAHVLASAEPPRRSEAPVRAVALSSQGQESSPKPYAIQESSWPSASKAKQRAGQLATRGIPAWVKSVNLGHKGVWHRVMIGSFDTLAMAKRQKNRLSQRYALSHILVIRVS